MAAATEGDLPPLVWRRSAPGSRATAYAGTISRFLLNHDELISLGIYLALALVWYRTAVAHMGSSCTCIVPGDAASIAWALEWFPHALFHGLNLLHSKAMWSPTGINLAGATAVPFLAFLMAPVTWLWGPIVAYNVITIAAPVASAWGCYWLCRYLTKAPAAAILAGATYGFGTYEIAQNNGHLQMSMAVIPPLVALCMIRYLHGRSSKRRFAIQLTVLLLIQMFVGAELLFTMSVLGIVALALGWVFATAELRGRIVSAIPILICAYGILLLLSSWYVYAFLHAPNYNKDIGFLFYPTDALSFLTPMSYSWLLGGTFQPVTSLFIAGPGETNAYLGLPLAVLVARYIATHWERRTARWLTATLAVAVLWVLGTHLVIAGKSTIWLPYSLIARLPGFDALMQGRVALYVTLLCVVVLAMWLAGSERSPALRWGVGLLVLAFVVPNLAHPFAGQNTTWTNPAFFRTEAYTRYLRKGETIMPIAWGGFSESPMWQAEDHMYWSMANGYFLTSPPKSWQSQLTADLWADTPHASDGSLLRSFIAARDVSDVVVQQSELARWAPVLSTAGLRPSVTIGGVSLYRVPAAWLSRA